MFLLTHSQQRLYTVVVAVVLTGVVLAIGASLYARSLPETPEVESKIIDDTKNPPPTDTKTNTENPPPTNTENPPPTEEWLPRWVWTTVALVSIGLVLWLIWNRNPGTETSESTRKKSTTHPTSKSTTHPTSNSTTHPTSIEQQLLQEIERKKTEVGGYESESVAILKHAGFTRTAAGKLVRTETIKPSVTS